MAAGGCSVRVGGATVIEVLLLAICGVGEAESVTVAVKLTIPAVVGFPVTAPVPVLSDSPTGSEPELTENVYGDVPPLAIREEL